MDMTLIRLLDGTRVYLHAVIDNFSRRILAWRTIAKFDPAITAEILNWTAPCWASYCVFLGGTDLILSGLIPSSASRFRLVFWWDLLAWALRRA